MFSAHISQLSPDRVPTQLVDFISQPTWRDIIRRFQKSRDDAHCYACGVEVCCCLALGLFFVFCCHPCIFAAMHNNTAGDQATVVNYTYFNRAPVVRFTSDGYITVDPNLIPTEQRYQPTSTLHQPPMAAAAAAATVPAGAVYTYPVMVEASIVMEEPVPKPMPSAQSASTAPPSPAPPSYSSPATSPRMMRIVLPSGGQAGQQVIVAAPDGNQVAITLSAPVAPGQAVDVQY